MRMYLCPALMDWLIFFVLFAVFYSAGERGVGIWGCTLLGVIFQAAYMPGSVLAGYLLNSGNAKRFLLISTTACGLLSVLCLWLESFPLLMAALAFSGIANAFFFNSFQTFMRSEAALGMTLKNSVSMYNFAWSMGAGIGSLTAGFIYELGLFALCFTALLATAATFSLLYLHKSSNAARITSDGMIEHGSPEARPVSPAYVIIGWIMIFTVNFVQRPLFTFLPPLFAKDGTSSLLASLPLFGLMIIQALTALIMWRFRDHLYRRKPFWIMQALGALAFVSIWLWPNYLVCLFVLALIGVYYGFTFFCAIYYVSNSVRSSFNIGVNEGLVGLGSIAGIFAGDIWMRHSPSSSSIYLMCACALLVSMLLQLGIASFKKP